jgi:nucleoside-diphosphate-sugar epimerase
MVASLQTQVMPLFRLVGRPLAASEFTRNRIRIAASNRRFDISRAKNDLGYFPDVSMDEALQRTLKSFEHLQKDRSAGIKGKK